MQKLSSLGIVIAGLSVKASQRPLRSFPQATSSILLDSSILHLPLSIPAGKPSIRSDAAQVVSVLWSVGCAKSSSADAGCCSQHQCETSVTKSVVCFCLLLHLTTTSGIINAKLLDK